MRCIGRSLGCVVTILALLAATPAPRVSAQQAPPPAPKADVPTAAPQVMMPSPEGIVVLVRTTLLTLNDAVHSGNFTVLRDLAAPSFREANSAARLTIAFADLARRGINLSSVAILAPRLSEPPALDAKAGMLRVKGAFPGRPVHINFEMVFQAVSGRWRLFGLSVQPVPVEGPTTGATAPPDAGPPHKQAAPPAKKADPPKK